MRRVLSTVLICIAMSACTNAKQYSESWVGRHYEELVESWGVPQETFEFEDGRRLIAYSTQFNTTSGGFVYPGGYYSANTFHYDCKIEFKTDPNGIIESWDGDGNIGGCNRLMRGKSPAE